MKTKNKMGKCNYIPCDKKAEYFGEFENLCKEHRNMNLGKYDLLGKELYHKYYNKTPNTK